VGQSGNNFQKGSPSGRIEYPTCKTCGKRHLGECRMNPYTKRGRKGHLAQDCGKTICFECDQDGHIKSQCPKLNQKNVSGQADKGKGTGTSRNNARVFVMSGEEARRTDDVITGMSPINKFMHMYYLTLVLTRVLYHKVLCHV
jgi:hypothetical protein